MIRLLPRRAAADSVPFRRRPIKYEFNTSPRSLSLQQVGQRVAGGPADSRRDKGAFIVGGLAAAAPAQTDPVFLSESSQFVVMETGPAGPFLKPNCVVAVGGGR